MRPCMFQASTMSANSLGSIAARALPPTWIREKVSASPGSSSGGLDRGRQAGDSGAQPFRVSLIMHSHMVAGSIRRQYPGTRHLGSLTAVLLQQVGLWNALTSFNIAEVQVLYLQLLSTFAGGATLQQLTWDAHFSQLTPSRACQPKSK